MKMRVGGVEVTGPNEDILVLPRPNGDLVFRARACVDLGSFEDRFPRPKPPGMTVRGKGYVLDEKDKTYQENLKNWSAMHEAYMILKSLEPSDIDWQTVDMEKPSTWTKWKQELLDSHITQVEVMRIVSLVAAVNCLDEAKLEQAREAFLAGQGSTPDESSGPDTEPENTPSGQPVNDSESNPQE
jgi:hypothetical protein